MTHLDADRDPYAPDPDGPPTWTFVAMVVTGALLGIATCYGLAF